MFSRIIAWVAAVVRVIWQQTWGVVIVAVKVENGSGGSSPGCSSRLAQSIDVFHQWRGKRRATLANRAEFDVFGSADPLSSLPAVQTAGAVTPAERRLRRARSPHCPPYKTAGAVTPAGMWLAFQIPGRFAGRFECQNLDA